MVPSGIVQLYTVAREPSLEPFPSVAMRFMRYTSAGGASYHSAKQPTLYRTPLMSAMTAANTVISCRKSRPVACKVLKDYRAPRVRIARISAAI